VKKTHLARLHPGGLPVEHVDWLDSTLNHADGAVEESCQMAAGSRKKKKMKKTVTKFQKKVSSSSFDFWTSPAG